MVLEFENQLGHITENVTALQGAGRKQIND